MSSSSTSHQRLVQLEDDEEEKDDVDVKMEQIKGRKVVSIRRVGETTFTEIRRDLFSIIPGVLELRSQPEVYGNHLITVCCGSNTSCFIGPTRGTLLCTCCTILMTGAGVLSYPAICIHPAVEIVAGLLFLGTVVSYALTSFTNPGIIPKQTNLEFEKEKQNYLEKGLDASRMSVCNKCNIIRPPLTYHCISCNACITDIDHHCPFTGHCIGKNNITYFKIFIILLQCTIIAFIAIVFVFAVHSAGNCHMYF